MTIRGWMVVFCAVIFTMIMASCAKDNHEENQRPRAMSCAEQTAFSNSGVEYVQEGNQTVAYNGQGQRYVLSPEESRIGAMLNRCNGNRGFSEFSGMPPNNYQGPERRDFDRDGDRDHERERERRRR